MGWKFQSASGFFGLPTELREEIHKIIFDIVFYGGDGGGGFSYADVYNMPVQYRDFYIHLMNKANEEKSKAIKDAQRRK